MKTHKNHLRLLILLLLVLLACVGYMTVGVHFENQKLFAYAMRIRTPKLIAMLITAFAIGSASIVFQSIINNTIVTPCLLGMDQLYSLIHTAVFFVAGSGSFLAVNANAAFAVDLAIMGAVATVIYSYLFRKTNHNVLYVLLIGTVLTSFFSSIQTTLTRVMDPNEYDTLLTDLVASFSNVNSAILVLSIAVLALVAFAFRKELALLDVLTLGKDQAINLGVDYDRCIRRLLLGVTLYIATATAMVGPLAFLGLIIANLSRQFLRTYRHSQLITGSVLFGMAVLIGGQLLVVFLATDAEKGVVESTRENAMTIASIFGLEDHVEALMADFDSRIDALKAFAEGKTAIVGMTTSGSFNVLGNDGRCSIIGKEIGFENIGVDANIDTSTHGNEASFEFIVDKNPDYIFAMDRDAAIGTDGAQMAQEIMENELVESTDAYKNGHVVYLAHPNVWYTAEGGIQALSEMLSDLENALL